MNHNNIIIMNMVDEGTKRSKVRCVAFSDRGEILQTHEVCKIDVMYTMASHSKLIARTALEALISNGRIKE